MPTKTLVTGSLKGRLKRYLTLRSEIAQRENELLELKKQLDRELDAVAGNNEFQNGRLGVPGVAMISVAMNPPRLTWADGQALSPADREGVALLLPDKYVSYGVKVADLHKAIERGNTDLQTLLLGKGIDCVQESRYDIKPA